MFTIRGEESFIWCPPLRLDHPLISLPLLLALKFQIPQTRSSWKGGRLWNLMRLKKKGRWGNFLHLPFRFSAFIGLRCILKNFSTAKKESKCNFSLMGRTAWPVKRSDILMQWLDSSSRVFRKNAKCHTIPDKNVSASNTATLSAPSWLCDMMPVIFIGRSTSQSSLWAQQSLSGSTSSPEESCCCSSF